MIKGEDPHLFHHVLAEAEEGGEDKARRAARLSTVMLLPNLLIRTKLCQEMMGQAPVEIQS